MESFNGKLRDELLNRELFLSVVDNDIHRVLVTQEGKLVGIISTSDFARLYAQGRLQPA